MTRLRFTAVALSAAALGLAAVLVPTSSIAEPIPETPAATPTVIWADAAEDFVPFNPVVVDGLVIPNEWQWTALGESGSPFSDFATFGPEGLTSTEVAPFALVHGLPAPIQPADLAPVVAEASANTGANAQVGIFVQELGDEVEGGAFTIPAVGGFNGADTQWMGFGGGTVSTDVLVEQLADGGFAVTGYFAIFQAGPIETTPPVDEENPPVARLSDVLSDTDLSESAPNAAARAVVPAETGIASYRFGDLTTYFTPQPTAVLTLARASFTAVQASTTGVPVTGSGFAPGETVTVGLSSGQSGSEVEGVTFLADADGNVSGTVVLPAGLEVGEYSLVLVGSSSSQFAASALVITAGGAPVAVPVPGRANYAG
ncbi:hypothetical protein [Microbacterium sp. NPDC087665]|uniref:hypothetical protein n=1 Tax=Microbacterium sp. NPDC087665 TaxID=3364194 RepID=UPI00382B14BF